MPSHSRSTGAETSYTSSRSSVSAGATFEHTHSMTPSCLDPPLPPFSSLFCDHRAIMFFDTWAVSVCSLGGVLGLLTDPLEPAVEVLGVGGGFEDPETGPIDFSEGC